MGCPLPAGPFMFPSSAPHMPPTGPFSSRPVFRVFPSKSSAVSSRAACPGDDSFQLMSSSGFKTLITLKESLFPRWKREV